MITCTSFVVYLDLQDAKVRGKTPRPEKIFRDRYSCWFNERAGPKVAVSARTEMISQIFEGAPPPEMSRVRNSDRF